MGDKIASKKLAKQARVNTIPGWNEPIDTPEQAVEIAKGVGYPVMIKASAGGGGKGLRVAFNDKEAFDGFSSCRNEARNSFGDDRVFIEKFIVNPRHIEIQVLGDKHGSVIYLGERECSIQRRNQKVVEEAPSPLLDDKTRKAMGEQAVALAKAVGYDSAGTVEFVAGQDRSFFFLEMNTRLQVEHPVTELTTGIDLVEQMIRVAAGEKLALKQSDVKLSGWAVESRIYAEDPYRNFLPSTGRLVKYRPPAEQKQGGITIRNDTGVYEGGEISIWYDPMIAKLCTHAPTRAEAVHAMGKALDAFYIEGIQHNVPFLSAIMQNKRWQSGNLSTGFIAEEFPEGFHGTTLSPELKSTLSKVAAVLDHCENRRKRAINVQMTGKTVSFSRQRVVRLGKDWIEVEVSEEIDGLADLSGWYRGEPVFSGVIDGEPVTVQVKPILNGFRLSYQGVVVDAHVFTAREAELARLMPEKAAADTSKKLLCPMPGLVVQITVAEGHEVKAGESLAIVEAMKMENILRAERDVTVKKINAKKGDSLAVDAVIMEFA
jgi:propionyl-CoA carboxylase alpha chain